MHSSTELLFTVSQIIGAFSTLIIFVAVIIIFIKKKSIGTWLILIGYLLVVITYIANLFLNILVGRNSVEMLLMTKGITDIVQSFSYLICAVGLIILSFTEFSKGNKIVN